MTGLAHQAAPLWGLSPDAITLAAQRENAVWRAEGAGGPYALRLHRPGYRTADELRSELEWMAMLARGGLAVPRPVPSRNGRLVEDVGGTAGGAEAALDAVEPRHAAGFGRAPRSERLRVRQAVRV